MRYIDDLVFQLFLSPSRTAYRVLLGAMSGKLRPDASSQFMAQDSSVSRLPSRIRDQHLYPRYLVFLYVIFAQQRIGWILEAHPKRILVVARLTMIGSVGFRLVNLYG